MGGAHQISPARAGTLSRWLGQHKFFETLAGDDFLAAEGFAAMVQTSSNQALLSEGDVSPYAWFLLHGRATLTNADGYQQTVHHTDAAAGYPLAHLRPARFNLLPECGATFVRFEQAYVKKIAAKPKPVRFLGGTQVGGGSWQSHPFALEVARLRKEGELSVPAMPGVSARIGQAMQDPDFAMTDLARLVGADPAIAGELIKVSNSALFRAAGVCETLQAAIVRLGLGTNSNTCDVVSGTCYVHRTHALG